MLGDPALLVILLSAALCGLALAAAGWVIVLHYRNQREQRLCNHLANLWRPHLLAYLGGAEVPEELKLAAKQHPAYFVGFLSRQASLLSGSVQDRLTTLVTTSGIEHYLRHELQATRSWRVAHAARLIALFEHPGFVPDLLPHLQHRSTAVVFAATLALARTGKADVLPLLLQTLTQFSVTNQDLVSLVLLAYGSRYPQEFASYLEKQDIDDENLYAVLLGVIGELHVDNAAGVLKAEVVAPRCQECLLKALRAIGETKAVSVRNEVLGVMHDERWQVRAIGAWALGKLKDPEDVQVLQHLLEDESWSVRLNAASALAELDQRGLTALESAAEHSEDPFAADMANHVLELHELAIPSR